MAQLAVAAIGAGISSWAGYGAAIGWAIGSVAGAAIFAPRGPDGPRVDDGKYTSNTYGQPIPLSYGTMRHAAQVLWFSGLHESSTRVGRNLFSRGTRVYSYSCDVLLSVCEGPQAAVLRIWGNGRLLWTYNGADGEVDGELLQPGSVRVYLGTEDQMPDPTYEAAVGTENAVPYRGEVVVAIDGLQLEFSGNRPPVFEVEVAQHVAMPSCPVEIYSETQAVGDVVYLAANVVFGDRSGGSVYDSIRGTIVIASRSADKTAWNLEEFDAFTFPPAPTRVIHIPITWTDSVTDYQGLAFDPENDLLYVIGGVGSQDYGKPFAYIRVGDSFIASMALFSSGFGDYDLGTGALAGRGGSLYGTLCAIYPDSGTPTGEIGNWAPNTAILFLRYFRTRNGAQELLAGRAWYDEKSGGRTNHATTVYYVPKPWGFNIVCIGFFNNATQEFIDRNGTITEIQNRSVTSIDANARVVHSIRRRRGYILRGRFIAEIDLDTPGVFHTPFTEIPAEIIVTGFVQLGYDEAADHLVIFRHALERLDIWTLHPVSYAVLLHCTTDLPVDRVIDRPYNVGPGMFIASVSGASQGYGVAAIRTPGAAGAAGNPVTLRSIVEDICDRSGLPAENLDASAGTDLVAGFKVARQTTGRAVIQSLQPGYFFDLPESGSQIVLRKRGAAPVVTIDDGELGARVAEITEDSPAAPYEFEHVEEVEAPQTLELTYIDALANYDPGLQRAQRQTGTSKAPMMLEVPVSLTAAEAERIAWANLLHAHVSKSSIRLALSHRFSSLEPADPIMVPLAGGLRRVRIDSVTRARPLLEVQAVLEDAAVYEQIMGGVPRYNDPIQEGVAPPAATLLALLDLPPLQDSDDSLLLYVALAGDDRDLSWSGATLYKSSDGGTSYDDELATTDACTMGTAETVLGDWTGGNVWDNVNTVDVVLTSGTFSSATELAVLNEANAVLIGDEIVQFTTAVLVDDHTWTLSGLLRGRRGTEYAIGSHTAGEVVVLLDDALMIHAPASLAEIGAVRHYKGVTANQPVADAPAQAITLAGNSIRPLSPVHIEGSRSNDDLAIVWVPRVRIDPYLRSGAPVTLDEPVEAYEIDILDGANVVRTLTASTPAVVYTATDQTTDFGSPQPAVDVVICQISSRAGRGHPGTATL